MSKPNITAEIYKSWSLEKLQDEYYKLSMKYISLKIKTLDRNEQVEKAERLIAALKDCLEEAS